jgi:protein-disulfide isomerase
MTRRFRLLAAAASMLAFSLPAAAEGSFTDAQKAEMGQIVRDYLLANPEILLEVSQALEAKQQAERAERAKASIGPNRGKLERDGRDHVLNPGGDITVVQFFDYNCGYCKVIAPEILEMARTRPNVRFVFKDMVIFGASSEYAAAAFG